MVYGKKMFWAVLTIFILAFVPACGGGGGGGSNDIASTAYTGERSKAYLDSNNAEALILGAYEGLDAENIIPLALETSTSAKIRIENPYNLATLVERTLLMAQPGNRVTMLDLLQPWELCNNYNNYPNGYTTDTLKETNNGIKGDINFFNCNLGDSLDVIILDGKMTVSFVEEGNLIKASMTMSPLHMFDGVDRYGLYGKIGATFNEYDMTFGMTINMTLEETSGRTYWLNNYKMDFVEKLNVTSQHWGTELTISGRYYSNDHGYVDFVTEEVIFIPFNVFAPAYDGLIKFNGSNASHAYLWLGESQDDYCIKVVNDSGIFDIGTCAP